MSAFLWTVAIFGMANTAAVIFFSVRGALPPVTPTGRALDAVVTFCAGAWALWLLAKGV